MYTDYWTGDKIAFESNERIICGVVDGNLQPSHNRDAHYYTIVSRDPHAASVFPIGSSQLTTVEHKYHAGNGINALQKALRPRLLSFDGYEVYQPEDVAYRLF